MKKREITIIFVGLFLLSATALKAAEPTAKETAEYNKTLTKYGETQYAVQNKRSTSYHPQIKLNKSTAVKPNSSPVIMARHIDPQKVQLQDEKKIKKVLDKIKVENAR